MKLRIYLRPLRYFLLKNWYGLRKGKAWSLDYNEDVLLLDLGAVSIRLK